MLNRLGGAFGGALSAQLLAEAISSGSAANAPMHLLESMIPGFTPLHAFIMRRTGIDIKKLVVWLFLLGAAQHFGQYLYYRLYNFMCRYCFSAVSIGPRDRLNKEVLSWMSARIVAKGSRFIAAKSTKGGEDDVLDPYLSMRLSYGGRHRVQPEQDERTPPVRYYPAVGTQWFFYKRRLFIFQRGREGEFPCSSANEAVQLAQGGETIVLMCIGRDPAPLKDFLQHCKDFNATAKDAMTTIHMKGNAYGGEIWQQAIVRPSRPLDTIDMDEKLKIELLNDVKEYLHPDARRFYARRGIPYRRGYLFHGPPGTGKSSFCLALAGELQLDLYMASLTGSTINEDDLSRMFACLPSKCIVLLEDIDSAGINREQMQDDNKKKKTKEEKEYEKRLEALGGARRRPGVSLSGLLNAIDGTSSQEGRLLVMTSNSPDALDEALIRPGRVDKQIYFGPISQASAASIYLRMFTKDKDETMASAHHEGHDLDRLAQTFAAKIPEGKLTPAEIQGFLLSNRTSPLRAIADVSSWIEATLAAKEKGTNVVTLSDNKASEAEAPGASHTGAKHTITREEFEKMRSAMNSGSMELPAREGFAKMLSVLRSAASLRNGAEENSASENSKSSISTASKSKAKSKRPNTVANSGPTPPTTSEDGDDENEKTFIEDEVKKTTEEQKADEAE